MFCFAGDEDDYDYEEAASYVTEAIYGNLEEVVGPTERSEDESSVFAATVQTLVKSGSAMRTLWCEMPKVSERKAWFFKCFDGDILEIFIVCKYFDFIKYTQWL